MKLTKKLIKTIVLELKEGTIREDLKEPSEMTLNQLETFEDLILENTKEGEQNDTINYFLKKVVEQIKIKSKNLDQLSLPLEKVASTKNNTTKSNKTTKEDKEQKEDIKEQKEDLKKEDKTKKTTRTKKGLKVVKGKKEDPKNDTKDTKEQKEDKKKLDLLKLNIDELNALESAPLTFNEIVKHRDDIMLLDSVYGVERIKIIDIDTDAKGKEYILIKSLDNKAVYDFIFKHKQVKNKKGTYKVKNSLGDIYSVTISKPL